MAAWLAVGIPSMIHQTPPGSIPLNDRELGRLDPRIPVPRYDRKALRGAIVHIGVGGFHRAHLATYIDDLCAAGHTSWAIVGSGVLPHDRRMADVLDRQDGLYA